MNPIRFAKLSMSGVLLLASLGALEAAEPEITLTVPLKISGIPAGITGGTISCKVGEDNLIDQIATLDGGSTVIRSEAISFSLDGSGSVSQSFVLHVKESSRRSYSQAPLSAATRYACFFKLGDLDINHTQALARAGTPFVQIVRGTIPR